MSKWRYNQQMVKGSINWVTTELNSLEVTLSVLVPWVLTIKTSPNCPCSHSVQIRHSNNTHSFSIVRALSQWPPMQTGKKASLSEMEATQGQKVVSKIQAKEERNGPPSANQALSTAKHRSSHAVCTLRVHPPTSPCPALSAGTEPKSQGHCWSDITST